jgi:hypothetical protein
MTALSRPFVRCRRCREDKPPSEYWPNPRNSWGLSSWCKVCVREASLASSRRYRERYNARRRLPPAKERICPVCGRSFLPTTHSQVYCPPTDEDRARAGDGQPRSWCAKAFSNAVQRGTVDQLLARARERGGRLEEFECAECGKRCVPGENVSPHASRFCCAAHKKRWHREHGIVAA